MVPQKPVLGMQVIDFKQIFGKQTEGVAYALSYIVSEKDTAVLFGFSCANPVKIWLNDGIVYSQKSQTLFAPNLSKPC